MMKSFFITFFIVSLIGSVFIMQSMNINNFQEEKLQLQVQKIYNNKRNATKEDIFNIIELIFFNNKEMLIKISLNPLKKDIVVENISLEDKINYLSKNWSLKEMYKYGGIKLILQAVNNTFNYEIKRYIVIENEDILLQFFDSLGSIEYNPKLLPDRIINKNCIKNMEGIQIINAHDFIKIINLLNNDKDLQEKTFNNLLKEYILQKITVIDSSMGEEMFKNFVNIVDTDISYTDFCNLKEVDLNFGNTQDF